MKVFESFLLPLGIKIPHFTTVIRWCLRLGLSLLSNITNDCKKWICIFDHTIQVGRKKAFVVLKVPLSKMAKALILSDVEILHIEIRERWNGDIVEEVLDEVFLKFGHPFQIIMDGGSDLKKGIKNLLASRKLPIKVTLDLTHFIANLLKNKYQTNPIFKRFMTTLAFARSKVIQTSLSYIMPPQQRSKSRFLNLPELAKWSQHMLLFIKNENLPEYDKIKEIFGWVLDYEIFLKKFCKEIELLQNFQAILKKFGLNHDSYNDAKNCIDHIEDESLSCSIQSYLEKEYEFFKKTNVSVLITSDIIESLFGKYKQFAKPHCLSEVNRLILLLPCICNKIAPEIIKKNFEQVNTNNVNDWIKNHASNTLLSKRRKVFNQKKEGGFSGHKSAGHASVKSLLFATP